MRRARAERGAARRAARRCVLSTAKATSSPPYVSFHAPDPADAGILARQSEIEELEDAANRWRSAGAAAAEATRIEAQLAGRTASLEQARDTLAARQQDKHAAQIEALKLGQALERYRERTAQIRDEIGVVGRSERDGARLAEARRRWRASARKSAREAAARERCARATSTAESALAEQRLRTQQAEREAQDAVFGEREVIRQDRRDRQFGAHDRPADRRGRRGSRQPDRRAGVDPVPAVRTRAAAPVEPHGLRKDAGRRARHGRGCGRRCARWKRSDSIESSLAPLRERINELRLKEQAAQINYDQYDTQLREASATRRARGGGRGAPRPSALQGEITRLTQAVNELGAVNLAALEELASGRERKGFLDSQSADLEEAVRRWRTRSAASTAKRASCCARPSTSVNRHFGSLFPVLFGGGEAKLVMTGEEILDAGVQVMAHPPGKRNTSIHLLSGGEKALTAISLVFALFQLNPAPFCLLDEVDAPLDDSNTTRFCDLVRKMSAQTQFLFISHNKITMEMATQLIGVTMPESGVSRVVAVDIEEALQDPGGARRLIDGLRAPDRAAGDRRVGGRGVLVYNRIQERGAEARCGARFRSQHSDASWSAGA
jgi:chromosome segregation protein